MFPHRIQQPATIAIEIVNEAVEHCAGNLSPVLSITATRRRQRLASSVHHVTFAPIRISALLAATLCLCAMLPIVPAAADWQLPPEASAAPEQTAQEPMPADDATSTGDAEGAATPAMSVAVPDDSDIDWDALNAPLDRPYVPTPKLRSAPLPAPVEATWSRNDRPDGAAALSLKRPVSPFWDTKAGLDLDVATQASPLTTPATLPDKLASDRRLQNSQGSAWITAKAPGVPYLSDQVSLEARLNPSSETRLGAAFSKAVPLWGEQFSLTLRNGYTVIQHDGLPGLPGARSRSLEMERSARLNITDTGTSFVAGQSLAAGGNRWLHRIGAEQALFGGLSIAGSLDEREGGPNSASITAGFKKSW